MSAALTAQSWLNHRPPERVRTLRPGRTRLRAPPEVADVERAQSRIRGTSERRQLSTRAVGERG